MRLMSTAPVAEPARPQSRPLPPFAVVLHNDDVNEMGFVVRTIVELARVTTEHALTCMIEAHQEGQAVVMRTHREHAELVCESFQSKGLTATIERAS